MKHLATLVVLCTLLATATAVYASADATAVGDSSNLVCAATLQSVTDSTLSTPLVTNQGLSTTPSSATFVGVSPVVPEPSSILAFCVGIVGLVGVCKRRH